MIVDSRVVGKFQVWRQVDTGSRVSMDHFSQQWTIIYLDNRPFLCDVTITDTLADSNLAVSKLGPGRLAKKKAEERVDKYAHAAAASQATHLPFAVETMGGLSESALRNTPFGKHALHMEGRGCHRLLPARQRGHCTAEVHRHGAEGEQGAGDGEGARSGGGLSGVRLSNGRVGESVGQVLY